MLVFRIMNEKRKKRGRTKLRI